MAEIAQAFQWINTTLKADTALTTAATGGVWQGFADLATNTPYALYLQQAGTDVLTMNVKRLFVNLLVQVKAIGPSAQYAVLVVIADRIDALLGRVGPLTLASGGVLACYREQTIAMSELINGVAWSHLGGMYRIQLQGS